jgi:Tfp pilus assembly protein PilV
MTLIEAAMVTVIIGVGVLGMLQLLAVGTVSNSEGTELTTAINLADNIREITLGMRFHDPEQPTTWQTKEASVSLYDDVLDLDDTEFSPPIDVGRKPLNEYTGWKQVVKVESVDENWVNKTVPDTTAQPTAWVTVTVKRYNQPVYTMSWLAVAR